VGEVMTVTENDYADRAGLPDNQGQQPARQSKFPVTGSESDGCTPGEWEVWLCLGEHLITRKAHPRRPLKNPYMERKEVIWPTWPATPAEESSAAAVPLADLQKYWSKAGNRLRDSAKWMATVIGAAIAAVIGTTPLASLNAHHLQVAVALIGLAGLFLLGLTLLLVLQVMRPEAVSYEDVQNARPLPEAARALPRQLRQFWAGHYGLENSLYRWKKTVESHEDLYLPCGVTSLADLRHFMAIEEVTLTRLAQLAESVPNRAGRTRLRRAQAARVARLLELRTAAAQVTAIGEYYALRARSTRATYGGIFCGLLGTAAVVLAFTWPPV
jgi:hypothetical protein